MAGLSFKGVHSSTFKLVMKSNNRQPLSAVTRYTQQVPGFDGVIDFGNDTYTETQKTVLLQYNYHFSMAELMAQTEKVTAWLYNDGEYHDLVFDDQPTRVFKAKVISQVDLAPNNSLAAISVTFVCNPPWPYVGGVLLTPEEIIWMTAVQDGNQYYQEFTAAGHMRFLNIGNQPVKPKIKLIGNIPDGLNLAYNGAQWQYNAALQYDSIIIDCAAETVTRGSDGSTLASNVDQSKSAFFSFSPGQINIDVTASGLGNWPQSLVILAEFTPQEVA